MPDAGAAQVERLVAEVLKSAKYRHVLPDYVRQIGASELRRRRNLSEAIKATKNKLHQVAAAYLPAILPYESWLYELEAAVTLNSPPHLHQVCTQIMAAHASTQERLPILDRFYADTLSQLAPIHSVLDVACGLNPLAIPWMPLAADVTYHACDIYQDMTTFLEQVLRLLGIRGEATLCDVIHMPPTQSVDVALILKAIPCLEQVDKQAGQRLLETVQAKHLLVSFPIHTLGGRHKGMVESYDAHFRELLSSHSDWSVARFEFATELAFVVSK